MNIKNRQGIKLIIFDLDGTLVNAYQAVALSINYTLEKFSLPQRSAYQIKRAVGWGDKQLLEGFIGKHNVPKALNIYRSHHARALATGTKFLPGAKDTLLSLRRQGYHLAIATNRPQRFTALILKYLNIRKYFKVVLCADQVSQGKPDPEILNKILKRLKISACDAVYVGDMTIDVQAGNAAGIKTIAVLTGSNTLKEIKAMGPFKTVYRIAAIKRIIKSIQLDKQKGGIAMSKRKRRGKLNWRSKKANHGKASARG